MQAMIKRFEDKEVQVYPNDSYAKFAKVIDINPAGVTFLVTKSDAPSSWPVNSIRFVAFSANLSFTLVE
jgi:hypothetical protein